MRYGEVLFFLDLILAITCALEYVFDIRNHVRMTTRVRDRVGMVHSSLVSVFAHDILDPSGLALPVRFFPRPADGGDVDK